MSNHIYKIEDEGNSAKFSAPVKKTAVRQFLNALLAALIVFDAIIAPLAGYKIKTDSHWLVDMKYALFTGFTQDRALLNATPHDLAGKPWYREGVYL